MSWNVKFLTVLVFLLSFPHSGGAESVGSPSGILKKGKWDFGLGTGLLSSREMEGGAEALVFQGGHFRGYGLTDWLSIYGKIGAAFLEIEDVAILKTNDTSTKNDFGINVFSSVQLKGKIFESKRQQWEWDGSVQYVDIRARHRGKNEARWHEWQFATSLAKSLGRFKPYGGLKLTLLDVSYRVRQNNTLLKQGEYNEDQPLGIFVGADYYFGQYEDVVLNIEGSSFNGNEMNVALSYLF